MYRALQTNRRAMERHGSGGAPQPAERTADASQLGVLPTVRLNLGNFNCGIMQAMLSKAVHQKNLSRVIAKAVGEQDLHMVSLCEVGGHKEGLHKTQAEDLVSRVLTPHYKATSCQAYMVTWQAEEEPTDDNSVTLTQVGEPEVVELPYPVQPQLMIMVFTIDSAEHRDKQGLLISGTMHIRTPKDHRTTIATRKRITKAALQVLEERASLLAAWQAASSGASQPTAPVIVLTGDVNLDKTASDSIVQQDFGDPTVENQWQVKTSNAALSGDVLFVKGAFAKAFDVTVGASYADPGLRKDCHDFFGVALSIPMSDKNGKKRQQLAPGGATQSASKRHRQAQESGGGGKGTQDKRGTPHSSTSGATQPASSGSGSKDPPLPPAPEDPQEKRVAKNNVAYTKAAFLAFYWPQEYAEQEWAAAPPVGRTGKRNALTGRVMPSAEKIVQEMYEWYEARVDDQQLPVVFRHLQNTLFKNVTVQLQEDEWKHPDDGGASQLAVQGEAHLVVSREHVACQVQKVITSREKWLQDNNLPLNTVIRGVLADRFLSDAKKEFHDSAEQQERQGRDAQLGKKIQEGKHSRWSRHIQKLGGTGQMWTLLSFTGRFDVKFLEDAIARDKKASPRMPGENNEEQMHAVRDAQMARASVRRGAMLERLQERLQQEQDKGKGKHKGKTKTKRLSPKQLQVLKEYQNGELRRKANRLTLRSGHGRLSREDNSFVDIGGSTGGFVRTVLDDWEPPDLAEFEE
jgi:hypothetical protein